MSEDAPRTDQGAADEARDAPAAPTSSTTPRVQTSTTEIDSTIIHPGSVRINVKGAFIVDQDSASPSGTPASRPSYGTKDIRLPYHTAVVSHIAVDVRAPSASSHVLRLIIITADRWNPSQACLLLPRALFSRTRWPPELYKLRDQPYRRLHRVHEAAEDEAANAQWIKARGTVCYSDRRGSIQILRQDPGRLRR